MTQHELNTLSLIRAAIDTLINNNHQPQPQPTPIYQPIIKAVQNQQADEPQLCSFKQAKFLFALSQQHGLTTKELDGVLKSFGVTSGWTGDIQAQDVNECAKMIKEEHPLPQVEG